MRNVLQEKLEYVSKVSQLQVGRQSNQCFCVSLDTSPPSPSKRDYDKAEQECQKYKALYDSMKQEVRVYRLEQYRSDHTLSA